MSQKKQMSKVGSEDTETCLVGGNPDILMLCSSFLRVKPTDGLVRYPNISRQLGLIPKPQKYVNTSLLVEGDASYITILDQIQLPKYQIPSNAFLDSLTTSPKIKLYYCTPRRRPLSCPAHASKVAGPWVVIPSSQYETPPLYGPKYV